jgi:sigma-E factor negative regulatory protein RseC
MIDASGTITALDGDYAIIRMDEAGCGRCHEPGGCGGNPLGKVFCSVPRTFRVLNPGNSAVGSRVTVVIAEGSVRRSVILAYGLPLLALFLGAISGSTVAGEAGAIIGSLCGLLGAWLALRYAQRHGALDPRSQPFIRY